MPALDVLSFVGAAFSIGFCGLDTLTLEATGRGMLALGQAIVVRS